MTDIFGPLVTAPDVEDAVEAHLRAWYPTELARVERHAGIEPRTLAAVRSWSTINSRPVSNRITKQLPAIVIVSPGITGRPRQEGDGDYTADFTAGIAVLVSAPNEQATRRNAGLYIAAVREAIAQHPSLGGFAIASNWVGESFDEQAIDEKRTLGYGVVEFEITVSDVLNRFAGPLEPLEDPYDPPADWPTVETIDVEVDKT